MHVRCRFNALILEDIGAQAAASAAQTYAVAAAAAATPVPASTSSLLVPEPRLAQLSAAAEPLYMNHPLLLYYRRDVFEQGLPEQGLPGGTLIPQTWDELLRLAQRLNGTYDFNGDGVKDYALCLDHSPRA